MTCCCLIYAIYWTTLAGQKLKKLSQYRICYAGYACIAVVA